MIGAVKRVLRFAIDESYESYPLTVTPFPPFQNFETVLHEPAPLTAKGLSPRRTPWDPVEFVFDETGNNAGVEQGIWNSASYAINWNFVPVFPPSVVTPGVYCSTGVVLGLNVPWATPVVGKA
jgi:hypothetical protein